MGGKKAKRANAPVAAIAAPVSPKAKAALPSGASTTMGTTSSDPWVAAIVAAGGNAPVDPATARAAASTASSTLSTSSAAKAAACASIPFDTQPPALDDAALHQSDDYNPFGPPPPPVSPKTAGSAAASAAGQAETMSWSEGLGTCGTGGARRQQQQQQPGEQQEANCSSTAASIP